MLWLSFLQRANIPLSVSHSAIGGRWEATHASPALPADEGRAACSSCSRAAAREGPTPGTFARVAASAFNRSCKLRKRARGGPADARQGQDDLHLLLGRSSPAPPCRRAGSGMPVLALFC